uniref:Predicted gene, 38999 n=1 Tax=Nannospalax galili TaxID=1026970 RepID=A0A8C6W5J5_NANGA
MDQPKDGAAENGNSFLLPTPGTESCPFPALPPSFLSNLDPAHLGLPEHLASVTVPIRLDTLSYLLHSALLGTYNLQQSLPPCSCATEAYHVQSDTVRRPFRGRGRGWGYGGWEGQGRPPRGQGPLRWGPGRGQQLDRNTTRSPGAGPKTPTMTPPAQDGQKHSGALSENWEADY